MSDLVTIEDKRVLNALYDIPLVINPISKLSKLLGISPEQILKIKSDLEKKQIIRRFSPVFSHIALGFTSNAMLLFKTNNSNIDKIGKKLIKRIEISHIFKRENPYNWNLYAMVHAKSEKELKTIINQIINEVQVPILIGITESEIKKTSLTILEDGD